MADINISFPATADIDHNTLNNLQGGAAGEFYHLSLEQYQSIINIEIPNLQQVITQSETPGKLISIETDNLIDFYISNGTDYTDFYLDPAGIASLIGSTGMVLRVVNGNLNIRSDSGKLFLTGLNGIETNQPILGKDATLPKHYITLDQLNASNNTFGLIVTIDNIIQDNRLVGLDTTDIDYPFEIRADNNVWTEFDSDNFPDIVFDNITGTITGFLIEAGKKVFITTIK